MIIESIELKNYRNYEELHMELNQGTNILYGDNAQGKTNVLESVYVCCTSKSHRSAKDRDIIRFGQDESHIKLQIRKNNIPCRIDMHLKKNKPKGIAINGVPIRRASELFGLANVVFFSPEDLNIIKNGPSERRRFIDMELCQLEKLYVHSLVQYNRVLLQRNRLLKELSFKPEYEPTLDIWDEQLVKYGKEVIASRRSFIRQLGEIIRGIHTRLSGGKEEISVFYDPDTQEEELETALLKNRPQDIRQKQLVPVPVHVQRLIDGYLHLRLIVPSQIHQDFIFNTTGCIGRQLNIFIHVKRVDRLDETDRPDRNQIFHAHAGVVKLSCYVDHQAQVVFDQRRTRLFILTGSKFS